jgi:cyclophilin family peptidyl-prolyl cis-trans isomerase
MNKFCAILVALFTFNIGFSEMVTIKTNHGDITLELDSAKAPVTCENFMSYAKAGHYDGTIFHRVIDGFMVQGGGFTKQMKQKQTNAPIKNEAANGLKNKRGTVAMARTNDINSATSQFFINVIDNDFLDYKGPSQFGYCVFAKVIKGMDVIDKIRAVPTATVGPFENVPKEPVEILSVQVL